MSATTQDYYELLEVARDAGTDEIKRAYRKKAAQYHPDRNPGDAAAEEMFKRCTEAYTILSDPQKRSRYDQFGHAAFRNEPWDFQNADFSGLGDLLGSVFGDLFGGMRAGGPPRGNDLRYDLTVTFEEAALGTTKDIRVRRRVECTACSGVGAEPGTKPTPCANCGGTGVRRVQRGFLVVGTTCDACRGRGVTIGTPCKRCHGEGGMHEETPLDVQVPAGVEDGSTRSVRGFGDWGPGGTGDLHVYLHVEPHDVFAREGANLKLTQAVSFPAAALGTEIEVPTLDGAVQMRVPPGTASGKTFRLRGKGVPIIGSSGRGDLYVTVLIDVPKQLTPRQTELLQELSRELGTPPRLRRRSLVDKLRGLLD